MRALQASLSNSLVLVAGVPADRTVGAPRLMARSLATVSPQVRVLATDSWPSAGLRSCRNPVSVVPSAPTPMAVFWEWSKPEGSDVPAHRCVGARALAGDVSTGNRLALRRRFSRTLARATLPLRGGTGAAHRFLRLLARATQPLRGGTGATPAVIADPADHHRQTDDEQHDDLRQRDEH